MSGYSYKYRRSIIPESYIAPDISLSNVVVDNYYIDSYVGKARFNFLNGYLYSFYFTPEDEFDFDMREVIDKESGLFNERDNGSYGDTYYWLDVRLDRYVSRWISFFA
jgi:hypothetical protein